MEMEEIDYVLADDVLPGDYIEFDGYICEVKERNEVDEDRLQFISEDDREIILPWDSKVNLYGYTA